MNRRLELVFILLVMALAVSACEGGSVTDTTVPPTKTPVPSTKTSVPSTKTSAPPTATPVPSTATPEEATPEDLGKEIGAVYAEALINIVDLVKDKPPVAEVRPQVEEMKETYVQKLVELGWEREALSEADRATVDLQIRLATSELSSDEEWLTAFNEATQYYFEKDHEFHQLLVSFNIIGQYASFDLLKKQEPEEAVRLGILEASAIATGTPVPSTVALPPSLALELGDEKFRDETGGYALNYPDGWQILSFEGTTVVYESEEALAEDIPAVPVILIEGGFLETLAYGEVAGAQNAQEMIQTIADVQREEENFEMGQVQELTVAGAMGAFVDLSWSDEGVPIAGRAVAIHLDERGVLITGAGTAETWKPFIPTFEAVLASISFFEPTVPSQ